jgi:hypothetical protein
VEQFKRLGINPKQEIMIPQPAFPEPLRYLWIWFREIHSGVQGNGTTYPVVTWEAIDCWARLTRQEIAPREAQTIIVLGNIWASIMAEKAEKKLDMSRRSGA